MNNSYDKNDFKSRKAQSQLQRDTVKGMRKKMKNLYDMGGTVSLFMMVTEVGENVIVYSPDSLHTEPLDDLTNKLFESAFELMRQHKSNERSLEVYQGMVKEFKPTEIVFHILNSMAGLNLSDMITKQCINQASIIESSFDSQSIKTWAITISENNAYIKLNQQYTLDQKFLSRYVSFCLVLIFKTDIDKLELGELRVCHQVLTSMMRISPEETVNVPPQRNEMDHYADQIQEKIVQLMENRFPNF